MQVPSAAGGLLREDSGWRSDMGTLKGFPCPPTMVRRRRSRRAPHATRQLECDRGHFDPAWVGCSIIDTIAAAHARTRDETRNRVFSQAADAGRGLEPTMKEKDVRDYIRTFLRNGVQNLVVPASMGIGLALVGCSTSPLMSNPDGAGDSSSMLPGSGGAGGTSSTGVPGTGGTMYGQGGFSNGGSTGGGTGGRSSTGVPGTGGTVYGSGGFSYPGSTGGGTAGRSSGGVPGTGGVSYGSGGFSYPGSTAGGAGGRSSGGVPGSGGTVYGTAGFSYPGSGGGAGGRSSGGVPGTGGTVYGTGGFPYPGSRDGGMSDAVAKPEESDAGSASDAMTSEVGAVEPTSTLDASRDGETGE